jgi:hypothetical protein
MNKPPRRFKLTQVFIKSKLLKTLGILFVSTTASAEMREWTNSQGSSFTGELKSVDQSKFLAKIERADGRLFEVDYRQLIEGDVAFIESFIPQPKGLVLAKNWETAMLKGATAASDLDHVLNLGGVKGGVDLTQGAAITIYAGIKYLEELDKAKEILKVKYGTMNPLTNNVVGTSGFPSDSLRYHSFKGDFDGFGHMILVTDLDEQVVAVQLLNNIPKSHLLSGHSNRWSVFNFIQNRIKGSSSYAIAYSVQTPGEVLKIDSELVDSERKSREWIRLYLPKKIAGIIRHLISPI